MTLGADVRTRARLARIGTAPISAHRWGLGGLSAPMYNPGDGGGGNNDDDGDGDDDDKDPPKPPDKPTGWNDDIQAYVNSLIKREVTSAKKKTRTEIEQELETKKQEEEAEAERKRQEESGEYEKVKATLIDERDTARTELTTVTAERDELVEFFNAQYERSLTDLPELVLAFKPDDDASVSEKRAWLEKALSNIDSSSDTKRVPKGRDRVPPKPDTRSEEEKREEARLAARKRGAYRRM